MIVILKVAFPGDLSLCTLLRGALSRSASSRATCRLTTCSCCGDTRPARVSKLTLLSQSQRGLTLLSHRFARTVVKPARLHNFVRTARALTEVVAVIPDPRVARSLRFSPSEDGRRISSVNDGRRSVRLQSECPAASTRVLLSR